MEYIIESPQKTIDFSGISNGECRFQYKQSLDAKGVYGSGNGIAITSIGLSRFPTTFKNISTNSIQKF